MNPKEVQEKIKKLGLKSGRMGGTGSMRMKAKKRRRPKKEEVVEKEPSPQELNDQTHNYEEEIHDLESFDVSTLDQEIQHLESQLEEIVPTITI
jgi:NACalpha-BTF3-like transcription factor